MICFGDKIVTKLLYTIFVRGIFNINLLGPCFQNYSFKENKMEGGQTSILSYNVPTIEIFIFKMHFKNKIEKVISF
jgi:hypothetical protein